MVSVAYLVFTFLACVLCAGLGMMVFRARGARLEARGLNAPVLKAGNEEENWTIIQRWQARENRAFVSCLAAGAGVPVVLAALAWTARGEVVGGICSGLATVSMNSPLCF
jgi:hypothetical protein